MQSVVIQVTVMLMHVTPGQVSDRLIYHAQIKAGGGGGGVEGAGPRFEKDRNVGFFKQYWCGIPGYHKATKISQNYQDIT